MQFQQSYYGLSRPKSYIVHRLFVSVLVNYSQVFIILYATIYCE